MRKTVEERFWEKVNKTEACWLWVASTHRGYGQFSLGGKPRAAYRVAYELAVGPIPAGLDLDHLCRNRACVNPAHLEPVTRAENVLRGVGFSAQNARKTHCSQGHPYDEVNTSVCRGWRVCRTCHAAQERARCRAA